MDVSESKDSIFDQLVHQFSDPFSFLRELVQNAVDAGSHEIDVYMTFLAEDDTPAEVEGGANEDARNSKSDRPGIATIHVDDFGEGMDRQIIESKLTRLFSSQKEGDLTKAGKFGIGFVSVFSIEPDVVCVDTAQGGESYRVIFLPDRSFECMTRDEPMEGTRIQVFKHVTHDLYLEFRTRVRETLRRWCRYIAPELRFEGEVINEDFDLDALISVKYEEPGTRVVVGFSRTPEDHTGFYNRGLTLLEQAESELPGISCRIDSRYLEHTLSRDNVVHDHNFYKVVRIARRLAETSLVIKLFETLEKATLSADSRESSDHIQTIAARCLRSGSYPRSCIQDLRIVATISGQGCSLSTMRAASRDGRLYCSAVRSPVTERLEQSGALVVDIRRTTAQLWDAIAHTKPEDVNEVFYVARPDPEKRPAPWRPLADAAERFLGGWGARLSGVAIAHLAYPGSPVGERVAVTPRRVDEPEPVSEIRNISAGLFSRRRWLIINADHPTSRALERIAGSEPEFAAYTLVKLLFLGERLDPTLDSILGATAMEQRCQRLNN